MEGPTTFEGALRFRVSGVSSGNRVRENPSAEAVKVVEPLLSIPVPKVVAPSLNVIVPSAFRCWPLSRPQRKRYALSVRRWI